MSSFTPSSQTPPPQPSSHILPSHVPLNVSPAPADLRGLQVLGNRLKHRYMQTIQYLGFHPSRNSTLTVPNSRYAAGDFLLGAGMVIIQPSTEKVVVCYDTKSKRYFLPKGRKDINESLEDTAVREASEESGYTVEHFPLIKDTCQPAPPANRRAVIEPNIEPIVVETHAYHPRYNKNGLTKRSGGEYFVFWYIGQIGPNATWTAGTGMHDEQNYEAHLYSFETALRLLPQDHAHVVAVARGVYRLHLEYKAAEEKERLRDETQCVSDNNLLVPDVNV